jgi:hypothetical protein
LPIVLPTKEKANPLWTKTYKSIIAQLTYDHKALTLPIELWPEWETVFESNAPIVLPIGGEGSGKSFHAALYGVCHMVYDLSIGGKLYWVVGADFEDARKDFDYLLEFQSQLGNIDYDNSSLPSKRDQQCLLATNTGQTVVTISSYDFTKVAREEPHGIIGAEISRWFGETFERCEGRLLRQYPHAWGFMSGSFETSDGWLPDIHRFSEGPNDRGIRSFSIPSWANRVKYPGGREDPAIKRAEAGRSPEKFLERFGAVPVPSKRMVCHTFRRALHVDYNLEFDPELPVYIAIDPGGVVYAVLFVQFTNDGEVHILDEIYVHRWPHSAVINEFKARPLSGLVEGGAIDIASTQAQNAMPLSLDAWFADTGLSLWTEKHSVDDTVDRLLWALAPNPNTGRSRLRIHPSCEGLISEMGGGQTPVPDGGTWMRYETKQGLGPPMRHNDHACKALGYLLGGPHGKLAQELAIGQTLAVSYLNTNGRPVDAASYIN